MRQLKQEHNICEDIIDEWLSSGILVDLYPIVKGAMYLGEEGYSIKNVEKLFITASGGPLYNLSLNNFKNVVVESLNCIKRAGANLIFSYFTEEASEWLKD